MSGQLDLFAQRAAEIFDPIAEARGFRRVETISLAHYVDRLDLMRRPPPGQRPPRARRADPASSHEAADAAEQSGSIEAQQRRLLKTIAAFPGRSTRELADLAGIDRYAAGRRASELADHALIERFLPPPEPGRRREMRCWITGTAPPDAGERVVRGATAAARS